MSEANCVVSLSTSDGPFISGAELYTSLRGNCFLEDYLCCYLKATSLPLLLKMKMQEGEETSLVISCMAKPFPQYKGIFLSTPCQFARMLRLHETKCSLAYLYIWPGSHERRKAAPRSVQQLRTAMS